MRNIGTTQGQSENAPKRSGPLLPFLLAFFTWSIVSVPLACLPAPHVNFGAWDVIYVMDGPWRILNGQRPHVDYFSPLGIFPQILLAGGIKNGNLMLWIVATGAVLFLCCWFVALPRLGAWRAAGVSFTVAIIMVAPVPLDRPFAATSLAMFYNRIGWSFLTVVFLAAVPRRSRASLGWEGVEVLGLSVLVAGLFLTKLNFMAPAMLCAAMVLWRAQRRLTSLLCFIAVFLVVTWVVSAMLGVSIGDIIRDYSRLASAQTPALRIGGMCDAVWNGRYDLAMSSLSVIAVFAEWRPSTPGGWRKLRFEPAILPVLAGAAFAIFVQSANTQQGFMPLVGVSILIASEMLQRRRLIARNVSTELIDFKARLLTTFALFALAPILSRDVATLAFVPAWHFIKLPPIEHRAFVKGTGPLGKIPFPVYPDEHAVSDDEIAERWIAGSKFRDNPTPGEFRVMVDDGIKLLSSRFAVPQKILCLDYANPLPLALGWPLPRGGSPNMHFGLMLTEKSAWAAEEFFRDTDIVMLPRAPLWPASQQGLLRLYSQHLEEKWIRTKESRLWTLYERK